METVALKNGGQAAPQLIEKTMRSLRHLRLEDPIAFYELISKCKNPEHDYFRDTAFPIKNNGLANADGSIDDTVRAIVLSAIDEHENGTAIVEPAAEAPKWVSLDELCRKLEKIPGMAEMIEEETARLRAQRSI